MQTFFQKLKLIFSDKSLRRRLLFVIGALIVFRLMAAIPIPGIDTLRLTQFLSSNQFFGVLNIFSGGGLSNLSIIMLGVGPYITASIIMQLLTVMVPRLKQLYSEEGEQGRKKFAQYSRIITVPLAVVQALGLLLLLERQGILLSNGLFGHVLNIVIAVTGSLLLMWIGELITEFGIGNGVSLLIFAGIVAALPGHINQALFTFDQSQIPLYVLFAVVGLLVIFGVVFIGEAERAIPVTHAKQVRGMRVMGSGASYIPMRINQAGVIPIIFALSILLFPQLIGNLLANFHSGFAVKVSTVLLSFKQTSILYAVLYFVFVFVFTYFYTAVTFDPNAMSKNLQKSGAFIPGIRPGEATEAYLSQIATRVTFLGALFLGFIAIMPLVMQHITGITSLALGGTALLIVVSVVLDLIKKVDAQISMREY